MRVSPREMQLVGRPSKEQTLALVGFLALCNAFGQVTDGPVDLRGVTLPDGATRWAGEIMAVAGRGHRTPMAARQQVVQNRKRKVKARKVKHGGLVTGTH